MVVYTSTAFLMVGMKIAKDKTNNKNKVSSTKTEVRFFRSAYASPEVCCHIWEYLAHYKIAPKKAKPEHLLCAMMFLKSYAAEAFLSTLVGVTEKTYQKWIWLMIQSISNMYCKIIRWRNRLKWDSGNHSCKTTTDGTDFKINSPTPFSKRWYSHKFKAAGLRYEVTLSIKGGVIVWTNGPFPCGRFPDITIFRLGLMGKLPKGEKTEGDLGYRGQSDKVELPSEYTTEEGRHLKRLARSRHEHINA